MHIFVWPEFTENELLSTVSQVLGVICDNLSLVTSGTNHKNAYLDTLNRTSGHHEILTNQDLIPLCRVREGIWEIPGGTFTDVQFVDAGEY